MSTLLRANRIRAVLYFLALVASVLAARVWFSNFQWGSGARIDIALILLPLMAIARGATFGIVSGFLLGLIVDATAPGYMGASSVGFAIVGFASGSFGNTMYMDQTLARGVLVFAAVMFFDIVFGLLSRGIASPFFLSAFFTISSALLSGLIAGSAASVSRTLRIPRKVEQELPEGA